jgi:TPR repeat protein
MKKSRIGALVALSLSVVSFSSLAHDKSEEVKTPTLPVPFESVFQDAMNDPNVLLYYADQSFRKGKNDDALRWVLEAAKFNHPAAISNAKELIQKNIGTFNNREEVISFLSYHAKPKGEEKADLFAQIYLADYFRGDECVWFKGTSSDCASIDTNGEPLAGKDLQRSYFYYEGAAKQGHDLSRYNVGMMHILGQGVPRNVPLGLDWLEPLAENGNEHIAYIIGNAYQEGYWVGKDEVKATGWFEKSSAKGHPSGMIALAKNLERGVISQTGEEVRMGKAVELYEGVLTSIVATNAEKSEAAYRLGMIRANYVPFIDESLANKQMSLAISYGEQEPNESMIRAIMWKGKKSESVSLRDSIKFYAQAIKYLETLPLDTHQKFASVYQHVAHAYARGMEGDLDRDERRFTQYMSRMHNLLAETYVPKVDFEAYAGYKLFDYPGY